MFDYQFVYQVSIKIFKVIEKEEILKKIIKQKSSQKIDHNELAYINDLLRNI